MKFNKSIRISAKVPIGAKQLSKLSILNAKQIIENKTKASDRYLHSISDLQKKLGTKNRNLSIEGYDISHLSGTNAVASCVRFNEEGPDKRLYRIFNIPLELSGNDTGSLAYALKRRILKKDINSLPNIILIDGGQLQLNAVLDVFNVMDIQPPIVLSIVKGSKRIRASETILSQNGIIEISKDSAGFRLLQQVRDESHRFALKNSRNKKNKETKYSTLNLIEGLGPVMQKRLINKFKSFTNIKNASSNDLLLIPGIGKKLCERIKEGLN
jgi:excinuclease ABC subunit C